MRKFIIYTLICLLLIILGVLIISCSSNYLRESEDQIKEDILKLTPIGISIENVLELIESKEEWEIVWVNKENKATSLGRKLENTDLSMDFIIGEKAIKANAGTYLGQFGFKTHVEVYWGFDENSKLIEVGIRKTSDSF